MDESDDWRISVAEGKRDVGAGQQAHQRKSYSESLGYAREGVMWR